MRARWDRCLGSSGLLTATDRGQSMVLGTSAESVKPPGIEVLTVDGECELAPSPEAVLAPMFSNAYDRSRPSLSTTAQGSFTWGEVAPCPPPIHQ